MSRLYNQMMKTKSLFLFFFLIFGGRILLLQATDNLDGSCFLPHVMMGVEDEEILETSFNELGEEARSSFDQKELTNSSENAVASTKTTFTSSSSREFHREGENAEGSLDTQRVDAYLEKQICENIYTACCAKVLELSRLAVEKKWSPSEKNTNEENEWIAAKEAALLDRDIEVWRLKLAEKERDEAYQAQPLYPDLEDDRPFLFYKLKKQIAVLAAAKVETSHAVLKAITVRGSTQQESAEAELNKAKKDELQKAIIYDQVKQEWERAEAFSQERARHTRGSTKNDSQKASLSASNPISCLPLISNDRAEELGRGLIVKTKEEEAIEQALHDLTNASSADHERWDARAEADRLEEEAIKINDWVEAKCKKYQQEREKIAAQKKRDEETLRAYENHQWNQWSAYQAWRSLSYRFRRMIYGSRGRYESPQTTQQDNPFFNWQSLSNPSIEKQSVSYIRNSAGDNNSRSARSNNSDYGDNFLTSSIKLDPNLGCDLDGKRLLSGDSDLFSVMSKVAINSIDYEEEQFLYRSEAADVIQRAQEAESKWMTLASAVEAERIKQGGVSINNKQALIEWMKADRVAVIKRCEQRELNQKSLSQSQKLSEADMIRWEALKEADKLAALYHEAKRLHDDQNDTRSLENKKNLWKEAKEQWRNLAGFHTSIQTLDPKDKTSIKQAELELKQADRAVNSLLNKVSRRYDKPFAYEPPKAAQRRLTQEAGAYKITLIGRKEAHYDQIFKRLFLLGDSMEKVIEKYKKSTFRDAMEVALKEISGAVEAWQMRVKRACDEEARAKQDEKFLNSAWQMRVDRFRDEDELSEQAKESLKLLSLSSHQAAFISVQKAIAEIDQAAFSLLKKEAARLSVIKQTWFAEKDAAVKSKKIKSEQAALSYLEGKPESWLALTREEQEAHNNLVTAANTTQVEQIENKIKKLVGKLEEARLEIPEIKRKRVLISASSELKNISVLIEKTEKALEKLKTEKAEKELLQRLGRLTPLEKKAEQSAKLCLLLLQKAQSTAVEATVAFEKNWNHLQEQIIKTQEAWQLVAEDARNKMNSLHIPSLPEVLINALNAQARWSAEASWYQAQKADMIANASLKKAQETKIEQGLSFEGNWRVAFETAEKARSAWEEALQVQQREAQKISPDQQKAWGMNLHKLKQFKSYWEAEVVWREAQKADAIARASRIRAEAVLPGNKKLFKDTWNQSIEAAKASRSAWQEAAAAQEKGKAAVDPEFQKAWDTNIAQALKSGDYWKTIADKREPSASCSIQ